MRNDFKQRPRPAFRGGGIALRGMGAALRGGGIAKRGMGLMLITTLRCRLMLFGLVFHLFQIRFLRFL